MSPQLPSCSLLTTTMPPTMASSQTSTSYSSSSDESGKPPPPKQQFPKKSGKKQQNQNFTASYPQYNTKSKPIPVQRSISYQHQNGSCNEVVKSSNRRHHHSSGKQQHSHQSKNSPVNKGGMGSLVTFSPPQQQRPSSLTSTPPPLTSLAFQSTSSSSPTLLTPGSKPFYAGAKFETNPSCMVLPPPPTHWTTMNNSPDRSRSQPSTPTIKSAPTVSNNGTATTTQFTPIDLAAFFGSPIITNNKPVTMEKPFPGQAMMQALVKNKQVESDFNTICFKLLTKSVKV